MPPILLFACYLAVALAPLALAWLCGFSPRPFRDEASSALALVGFSMLLMEFLLSGRFRLISDRMGIDATMRFHQLIARPMTVLLLIHPFLYTTPLGHALPWDRTRQLTLGLEGTSILSGVAAWAILCALVIAAMFRDRLPYSYEAWRVSHGLGAALLAGLGAHHTMAAGRYSGQEPLAVFWLVLLGLALASLAVVYVVRPLAELRRPYRVASVRPIGLRIWELVLEPEAGDPPAFVAGQFAWITLDCSPFAMREHPFSFSSAPFERPRIAFAIKEAGDFTNGIGRIAVGAPAYIDGPHGGLVIAGRDEPGLVFLAGGVGVAPILSMLRQLRRDGDRRPMLLLYGNRVEEQIIYRDELDGMAAELDLDVVHVLSEPPAGWTGETGQIDPDMIRRHCERSDRREWLYVVCGPPAMIDAAEDTLTAIGVSPHRIVSEKFGYF